MKKTLDISTVSNVFFQTRIEMKKVILLFIFISQTIFSFGQTITQQEFDEVINMICFEFAQQSVSDFDAQELLPKFNTATEEFCSADTCCNATCMTKLNEFLALNLGATKTFTDSIQTFKSNYSEDLNGKDWTVYVNTLLDENAYIQEFKNKQNRDKDALGKRIEKIKKAVKQSVKAAKKDKTRKKKDQPKSESSGNSFLSTLGILSTVLLLGAVLFYIGYLRPQYQKRVAVLKKENKDLQMTNDELVKKVKELENRIKELEGRNETLFESETELRNRLDQIERKGTRTQDRPKIKIAKVEEQPKNEEGQSIYDVFYMPIPSRDGHFEDGHKTNKFEWTESVYKFEVINSDRTKAVFSIMNDARMIKRAISGYDVYIKPVCKATNSFNINATGIVTEQKGQVSLNDGTWMLDKKAEIKYEA